MEEKGEGEGKGREEGGRRSRVDRQEDGVSGGEGSV